MLRLAEGRPRAILLLVEAEPVILAVECLAKGEEYDEEAAEDDLAAGGEITEGVECIDGVAAVDFEVLFAFFAGGDNSSITSGSPSSC